MTWNAAVPAGSDSIRSGDDVIRELKTDLATALSTEAIFPGADTAAPVFRWKPRRGTTAARPAADATNPGTIYLNSQTGKVERDNGTTWDEVASLTPAGTMAMYGGTTAPTNWLLCDGTSYLRADYPALFTAIGTAFGTADGTHFNVPDMRGKFPRGTDSGAGNDPDAAIRTAMATGGATGDNVGSVQADGFKSHNHPGDRGVKNTDGGSGYNYNNSAGSAVTVASEGGNETRPINVGVNFIIKT